MSVSIQPITHDQFDAFIGLINALADYEKLDRPPADAIERLRKDAFGSERRFEAFLAYDGANPIGYAICFETYSSFLAKPTMYLEDLFVLESERTKGAGGALFDHVMSLAKTRECGRMEWAVLDWNQLARDFYHNRDAEWLKEWLTYRITL